MVAPHRATTPFIVVVVILLLRAQEYLALAVEETIARPSPAAHLPRAAIDTTTIRVDDEASLTSHLTSSYTTLILGADILLTATIDIQGGVSGLVLDGLGLYKVDGQGNVPCITISGDGTEVSLQGLEVTGAYGDTGGLLIEDSTIVSLTSCTVSENKPVASADLNGGGGLFIRGSAEVSMTDCIISRNVPVGSYGGGIHIRDNTKVTMTECTVSGNILNDGKGAGICIRDNAHVTISKSTISDNESTKGAGGGLYITSSSVLVVLSMCTISGNRMGFSVYGGGGLFLSNDGNGGGSIIISGSKFFDNYAGSGSDTDVFVTSGAKYTLTFLSACRDGSYNPGVGTLDCDSCDGGPYPSNLLDGTCTPCPSPAPFSCCGAMIPESCAAMDSPGDCQEDQDVVCLYEAPTLAPTVTHLPTVSFAPTFAPSAEPTHQPTLTQEPTHSLPPTPAPTRHCRRGTYFNVEASDCAPCPAGTFSNVSLPPWPISCSTCADGTVQPDLGGTSCQQCDEGKFATSQRAECSYCSAGESSDGQQCSTCEVGRYAPQPLTGGCIICPPGSHTNMKSGATECVACDAGSFSLFSGRNCSLCPPGTFSPSGQTKCSECLPGYFAESAGTASCDPCPSLALNSRKGAALCDLASPGYYLDPTSEVTKSRLCPDNAVCLGADELPRPRTGFWVDRTSFEASRKVFRCSRQTCVGSELNSLNTSCWTKAAYIDGTGNGSECDSSSLQCLRGSRGPLCGSCLSGYIYSSSLRVCTTCTESGIFAMAMLGAAAALVALISALYVGFLKLPTCITDNSWLTGTVQHMDSGTFRVSWSVAASMHFLIEGFALFERNACFLLLSQEHLSNRTVDYVVHRYRPARALRVHGEGPFARVF